MLQPAAELKQEKYQLTKELEARGRITEELNKENDENRKKLANKRTSQFLELVTCDCDFMSKTKFPFFFFEAWNAMIPHVKHRY